tara:strand:+ start:1602 stop:2408 length:807 start_codon:yes stop_codon:yes gene_type:complete
MINLKIFKKEAVFGPEFNTKLLIPKENLFSKFWKNNKLNIIVSRKLTAIADDVISSLNLNVEIKDIIITGSIASYNWHELSDIDLHILIDFEEVGESFDLVKRMLDQTRINWNKKHNILIAGKEVELYFQHYTEPHESNGVWSLMNEKWITKPVKLNPEIDIATTEKKAEAIAQCVEHLFEMFSEGDFKEAYNYSIKIKDKIAKMRQSGLAKEGIYSPENLAFKMLRNAGYLEKVSLLKVQAYDKMMSLKLESDNNKNFNKVWKDYLA